MPWRSDAETADPYSIILFTDIRGFLGDLKSVKAKHMFRMVWLAFIGLNVPGFADELIVNTHTEKTGTMQGGWDDRWNLSYLTRTSHLSTIFPAETSKNALLTDSVAGAIIGREREYSSAFGGLKSWGYSVFDPLNWVPGRVGKAGMGVWGAGDIAGIDEAMVRRLFRVLRIGGMEDEGWDILSLAFELALNPKRYTFCLKCSAVQLTTFC